MKTIEIVGENYCGNWDKTRTACRGIVIDGDRILLSYAAKTNQWMIPGGGLESNESDEECCIREIAEETGIVVETSQCLLEIDEYYGDWKYCFYGQFGRRFDHGEIPGSGDAFWLHEGLPCKRIY